MSMNSGSVSDVDVEKVRCGYSYPRDCNDELPEGMESTQESCCYRPTWKDYNRCIWHAKTSEKKPTTELERWREPRLPNSVTGTERRQEILDGIWLVGQSLTGIEDIDNTLLRSVNFENVDLSDVDLSNSLVVNANFTSTSFHGTCVKDTMFDNVDFRNATIRTVTLADAGFGDVSFKDSSILNSDLSGLSAFDIEFTGTVFMNVNLAGAYVGQRLSNAEFNDVNVTDVSFAHADLTSVRFQDTSFKGTDLRGATLDDSYIVNCDFTGADLLAASLDEIDARGGIVSDSRLRDATIRNADLEGAIFSESDLLNVNFTGSRLRNADFSQATLENADFTKADLRGSNFRDARWAHTLFAGGTIDKETEFGIGPTRKSGFCAHDPRNEITSTDFNKATSAYYVLEELARQNALSRLRTNAYVRRKDCQRIQQYQEGAYSDWLRTITAYLVLDYGENPYRILGWSLGIISFFAFLYPFGLMGPTEGTPLTWSQIYQNPPLIWESLYYSTLTFTALGFGDFQPANTVGQFATVVETGLGAVMLALLVFVLGRRAAR